MNRILVDLTKVTEEQLEFWSVYQTYLAEQREMRRDRISDSLLSTSSRGFASESFGRLVDTRFQDRPLCSYGSIVVPPGGRFNFGEISTYYQMFQALYLASDFNTAFFERFFQERDNHQEGDPLSLRLDPGASFTFYRVTVSLHTVLDIRDPENLRPFLDVIAEIDPPDWLKGMAKKFRQPPPQTVKSLDTLHALLLDRNFTQWGSLVNQPAPSQWLGHYVRSAGINGILYPSVRYPQGYNLAVFPDTFVATGCNVELIDVAAGIRTEDTALDANNFSFQMLSAEQLRAERMRSDLH